MTFYRGSLRGLFSIVTLMICSIATLSSGKEFKKNQSQFGSSQFTSPKKSLKAVVQNYSKHRDKSFVANVKVEKVCQKKGCWMQVRDGNTAVRVKFIDYSFFVPIELAGKNVEVEGKLIEKIVSVKDARHYLEDGGATLEEVAKITEPQKKYQFIANGVRLMTL